MRSGKATHAVLLYVVEGKGQFPHETMRQDSAVFVSSADCFEAFANAMAFAHRTRRIALRRFYAEGGSPMPSKENWEMHGWKIVEVDGVAVPVTVGKP